MAKRRPWRVFYFSVLGASAGGLETAIGTRTSIDFSRSLVGIGGSYITGETLLSPYGLISFCSTTSYIFLRLPALFLLLLYFDLLLTAL